MFGKIERQRLSELVAQQIESAILSGDFAVGSQLPSEQQLADEFGVSRNVVREAFKLLQERGLITISNGSRAGVAEPSAGATTTALGRYLRLIGATSALEALYETRRILEGANVRLAVERADAADLEELASCLQRMRDHAGSIERWAGADLDFHLALARATHNPFMSVLLVPLVEQLREVMAEGYYAPGGSEAGLAAHTALLAAIERRDADAAYQIIVEHLQNSEDMIEAIVHTQQGMETDPENSEM